MATSRSDVGNDGMVVYVTIAVPLVCRRNIGSGRRCSGALGVPPWPPSAVPFFRWRAGHKPTRPERWRPTMVDTILEADEGALGPGSRSLGPPAVAPVSGTFLSVERRDAAACHFRWRPTIDGENTTNKKTEPNRTEPNNQTTTSATPQYKQSRCERTVQTKPVQRTKGQEELTLSKDKRSLLSCQIKNCVK